MKVWKFYKINSEELPTRHNFSEEEIVEYKYPLYAITNSKKLAKEFIKDRDMKKFIKIVSTDVDKEEYSEFANKNLNSVLIEYKIITKAHLNGKESHCQHVSTTIVITTWERLFIEDQNVPEFDDDSWWTFIAPSPYIFHSQYLNSLRNLQYLKMHNLYNILDTSTKNIYAKWADEECDDYYNGPSFTMDELAFFVHNFSDTF